MKKKLFTLLVMLIVSVSYVKAQDDIITFDIGAFEVTLLSEGQRLSGTNILIGATDAMLKQAIPAGTYPAATNVFLVETEDKSVLIDAGLGPKTLENLQLYGRKASDIDAIFITHFHGDHTGSLLIKDTKSYPNATLFIAKPEYDYYMSDQVMAGIPENSRGSFNIARRILAAYKDKISIFTPEEIGNAKELMPGIRGVAAYGHTPGHAGYMIESNGEKLFFWGDLTHAMDIQMPFPEVAVTYDTDPVKAVDIRQKLLKYLADNKIPVAGAHIAFPGMGDIRKNNPTGYIFSQFCDCGGRTPEPKK
jgi:glyoxylase-like metal-dependent hydrolase (beta-lactamase superfamily II)